MGGFHGFQMEWSMDSMWNGPSSMDSIWNGSIPWTPYGFHEPFHLESMEYPPFHMDYPPIWNPWKVDGI
jgi:hypothetical protein